MQIPIPFVGDYPTYFSTYINIVGGRDVAATLTENARTTAAFFINLPFG
ncbi:MAG: hypothetical protein RI894_2658, partial [Bacteroidota bacterium]